MSSKYCSVCIQKLPISSFLKDTLSSPNSRAFATCISCRASRKKSADKKCTALQSLDPNIQLPIKRVHCSNGPQPTVTCPQPPLPPNLPVELPLPNPLPELQPPQALVTVLPLTEPTGFLPTAEWQRIQDFNRAIEAVQLETCQWCQERGFSMALKEGICHCCFLRDTDNRKRSVTPFLMSAENNMDPGTVPRHLPELTQVKEMVIAQAHVQMLVKRVRGHQYHYTGHCVTFLQNIVQTVDVLPNLPEELDIILLQPPKHLADNM
jgi:hypothetical protein